MGKDKIKITDIAKLVGVSAGTVDRVLHNRSGVSTSSREKIEKALQTLNYIPNKSASALARTSDLKLAALIPEHTSGAYYQDIEEGMQYAVTKNADFRVNLKIFYYDQYNSTSYIEQAKALCEYKSDGVIINPNDKAHTSECVDKLKKNHTPFVYIDSLYEPVKPLAFYGQNAEKSGELACKFIMMLNFKKEPIVIFRKIEKGRVGSNQQLFREKGFREKMSRDYPDIKILEVNLKAKHSEEDEKLFDMFFAENTNCNLGVIFSSEAFVISKYLKNTGKKSFKFIGYDVIKANQEFLKEGFIDFLIAQRPVQQGILSVQTLCDYILFGNKAKQINYMPIDIITAETLDFYLERGQ